MWSSGPLRREHTRDEQPRFPMHNLAEDRRQERQPSEGNVSDHSERDGTWGERDVGGPVSSSQAYTEYDTLRRELGELSRTKSRASDKSVGRKAPSLTRKRSKAGSIAAPAAPQRTNTSPHPELPRKFSIDDDLAATATSPSEEKEEYEEPADDKVEQDEDFHLDDYLREGHMEKRTDQDRSAKRLGVIFRNLTVKGVNSKATYVKTLPKAIMNTFGPDLYSVVTHFFPKLRLQRHVELRDLIHDFTGAVRDGEMMLVLGRPGSGCSTFLKAIANNREDYAQVTGDVSYGGIPANKQKKMYRGEVNYNPEDDVHFPDMNVLQTFVFALMTKTKKRDTDDIPIIVDALLKMFGISHTKYTKVGNEYVRGISGGERKRVSIAETLATKSSVLCWDNSTRGLDASTALDYAKSLRIMTDVSNKATLVTLYQAGQGIYDLMDKVLLIDSGRCIYQGPANEARQYFIDLGFEAPPRQTTADFLTAVTDANERRFRDGFEDKAPKTPEDLEAAFKSSSHYQQLIKDTEGYEAYIKQTDYADAKEFENAVAEGKSHRTVSRKSPYTVSYFRQVWAACKREWWLLIGDTTTLYTKIFIIVANSLIVASLFYGQPQNTAGAFSRGGTLFFGILFLGWLQLTELMKAVTGRAVIERQRDYAFYRPSAVSVARILVDLPVLAPQVILFSSVLYFMAGLQYNAGAFFIYLLFVYVTTINLTALYRMFAALSPTIDDAVRFSGISLNLLVIYTGYVIPKPQLVEDYIWFGWLYYVNPLSYSFEAVLTNEFSGRTMECAPEQLVPQSVPGSPANPQYQGCSIAGGGANSRAVPGTSYLLETYDYTRSHLWRNFGVLIAYTALYIIVTIFAVESFNLAKSGGGALIFKKSRRSKQAVAEAPAADEEKGTVATVNSNSSDSDGIEQEKALNSLSSSESIFTWENVNLKVPYMGGEKQLLHDVSGYAKPGLMVALMGASGAGKTTLLNTLSQRNSHMGVITGDMLVDGRPLNTTFQRGTGFCEQMDLHDGTATIREALEFSALLRQDRSVPRQEKLDYVNTIIDLLELGDMQDAIISCLGVEQRKRLTIGVELAAKPQLLLFLDEPTSGLDSQSAYSIVRFLRKLSHAGQAIVCTIHQPSSVLIQQFDMILALNPGGNTFYFGPVGENGQAVVEYFKERGFTCPPEKNIAEFILETAAKSKKRADGTVVDWNDEWRNSQEAKGVLEEIQRLKSERSKVPEQKLEDQRAFAASSWTQTQELTIRTFKQYWRDPSYLYGKLFVSVIVGIFNGFTFWQLGTSIQDMQNRMFSAFLILTIPPTVVNAVVPKFFTNMSIWQARELPSRIYGWQAFVTAQVLAEIPWSILASVLYWILWYYPAGLPYDTPTAGYTFLMTMLFFLFQSSWGQWITAFAPNFTVIANVLPFFFVMVSLFNGVIRPYSELPVFWYSMYWANPATYWIAGVLGATLHNIPVDCTPQETAMFSPPPGQTCQSYAGAFASSAGGYITAATRDLMNPEICQYCPYTVGDGYLSTLNIQYTSRWRNFGVFLAFCVTNVLLVYFFIWSIRIKGWTFGMDILFGFLGKIAGLFLWPFKKLFGKKEKKSVEQA